MLRVAVILGLVLWPWIGYAQTVPTRTYVLQNAAASAVGGTVAHALGFTTVAVQIVVPAGSSPHFVIQFQQSLNAAHWTATLCNPLNGAAAHSGVSVTPAAAPTAPLHWRCNITGAVWFRSAITSYAGAGHVTAYAVLIGGGSVHAAALMRWVA